MPEIIREFTNFTPGELTYHESVSGGEVTAQEMVNLRVDTHGALRQRQSIRATLPANTHNITGVAATTQRLYFINDNGQLFYRNPERSNQSDTEIPVYGRPRIITDTIPEGYIEATKLSGRISVIYEYEDFDIITSEGEDRGYWIDLTDDDEIIAYPLGFDPPTFEVTPSILPNSRGGVNATQIYFYRFTYVYDLKKLQEEMLAVGKTGSLTGDDISEEPFNDMESNPTEAISTQDVPFNQNDTQRIMSLSGINFPNPDGLETGIAVYRSRPIRITELNNGSVTLEDQDLDFRRVGVYPPLTSLTPDPGAVPREREEEARFDDDMNEETRSEQVELRFDNDRMPDTVKTFDLYNDRIFAPNHTELRYSDIRFGNLVLWAYPEVNAIRSPVRCDFAKQHREILFYGGRDGLWRITGNAEYNFNIDRISNLGPISGYATTTNEDVFGYISPAGLHQSDGVSTQDISEPLQAYFENQETIDGSVMFLPNGHSVWSVLFARLDGSTRRQTFVRARQWSQWTDIEMQQNARFDQVAVTGDTETIAVIAEDTPFIRQVLWENLTGIYDSSISDTDTLIPIGWLWKSQKLNFGAEGIATRRKRFTELIIEGKADTEVNGEITQLDITFNIYDTNNDISEVTAQTTLQRDHLYKTRVPIRRIGQAIEFIVSGQGNIDIRSFCLKGNI